MEKITKENLEISIITPNERETPVYELRYTENGFLKWFAEIKYRDDNYVNEILEIEILEDRESLSIDLFLLKEIIEEAQVYFTNWRREEIEANIT